MPSPGQTITPPPSQTLSPTTMGLTASSLAWRGAASAGWVGVRNLTLEPAPPQRTHALSLALVVILAVIPPGHTEPNQTTLTGSPA
jgi:hypothetical protein